LRLLALLLALALVAGAGAWWWTQQPLPLAADALEISVPEPTRGADPGQHRREMETGRPADRGLVAGVFINRLRIGMRAADRPDGRLRPGRDVRRQPAQAHLQTDTPYNTYTRAGLPPTPIARRARRRCWLRCSRPPRRRCTSWRAAMAAASFSPSTAGRYILTTARSTPDQRGA
jgi:hypothetical protein